MAIRDYSKGKIYKIVVDTDKEYKPYVGSTIEELCRRFSGHLGSYRNWKNGRKKLSSCYDLFDKFGIENCKIILLEEYPCDSKMKLLMKEREWFDKIECCNRCRPKRTEEELKNENKENYQRRLELNPNYNQEHYQKHKEQIIKQHKIYREANKELISEKQKEWYQKNKNKIAEQHKETFTCDCGSISTIGNKSRHERSLKHQNYLSSLKV